MKPKRTSLSSDGDSTRVYDATAFFVAVPNPPQLPNLSVPLPTADTNGPLSAR
jgi:hypothetical protein